MTHFWCCDASQGTEKLLGIIIFKRVFVYWTSVLNVMLCVVLIKKIES